MLHMTLATEYLPGTNLNNDLACADWRFLLPSLQLDNVLCLGVPEASTLAVLATVSQRMCVVSSSRKQLRKLCDKGHQLGITNLWMLAVNDFARLPFADNTMALVLLASRPGITKSLRDASMLSELTRLLRSNGMLYFEINGLVNRYFSYQAHNHFRDFGTRQTFWLAPSTGRMHTALPLRNNAMARYFFTNVMPGQSFKKQVLSRVGKGLSRLGLLSLLAPRRAVLMQRSETGGQLQQLPHYLVSLAQQAGIDVTGYRYGLSARGRYNSNKGIFYLFKASGKTPEVVIKITRAPEFNYRLENEWHTLSLLVEKDFVDPATFPQPLFFGYHQNLAILGQKAVLGQPFRTRTEANARCPVAQAAINWIVQLGIASADTASTTPKEVATALTQLLGRFTEVYDLSSAETTFLREQIEVLGHSIAPFPLVLQHGDPGTWNLMVLETGQVAFIDWEAGEPQGMPLWDLFYFLRTYGSWVSRSRGDRNTLTSFAQHFLAPSALSTLLAETTEHYCARIGLERHLVEPLFYMCWMHRALKECTRLTPHSLETGHYVNLLRLCIQQRTIPFFKPVLSQQKPLISR